MRQQSQSPEDAKFRKLLENLQYKACTMADIKFLHTHVAGRSADKPKLNDVNFRNVSMILSWNSHRDKINELDVEHFVKDTNQKLHTYYSHDTWFTPDEPKNVKNHQLQM